MVKQEEIVKLIKDGFDLELISFELDVPMEILVQLKHELENTGNRKNSDEISKMQQMRQKYKELFFKSYRRSIQAPKELSAEEVELITIVTNSIEEKIEEMKSLSGRPKRSNAVRILSELKKIENIDLQIEQAEKLIKLLEAKELDRVNINMDDSVNFHINTAKRRIISKLAKAISIKASGSENIEELKDLLKKISPEMVQKNYMTVGLVRSDIAEKITKINQNEAINKIRNDIPEKIQLIIQDLANGNLDIAKADIIINEEAKKRVSNAPKNHFSLTEDRHRRQVLIQIRTAIRDQGDKYKVENPEKSILQCKELFDGEVELAAMAVVKNLISSKRFDTARKICDNYLNKDEKSARGLKNEIRNAEISDFIIKGINRDATPEEDTAYFNLIKRGLERLKVKPEVIYLGKSEDGLRNISLADIWPEGKEQKSR